MAKVIWGGWAQEDDPIYGKPPVFYNPESKPSDATSQSDTDGTSESREPSEEQLAMHSQWLKGLDDLAKESEQGQ
jgi:hypothetical protein